MGKEKLIFGIMMEKFLDCIISSDIRNFSGEICASGSLLMSFSNLHLVLLKFEIKMLNRKTRIVANEDVDHILKGAKDDVEEKNRVSGMANNYGIFGCFSQFFKI